MTFLGGISEVVFFSTELLTTNQQPLTIDHQPLNTIHYLFPSSITSRSFISFPSITKRNMVRI